MTEVLEITTLRLAQGPAVDWQLTTVLQHVEGARS